MQNNVKLLVKEDGKDDILNTILLITIPIYDVRARKDL
jgi:hypothetical protein